MNLSQSELTSAKKSVLSLGLNFALAPRKVPYLEIAAVVEDGARKLSEGEASELRGKVCHILKSAKPPKANLTMESFEIVQAERRHSDSTS